MRRRSLADDGWSDSSPLVNDLMAAGIRLCSYMIGVDPERSQTLIVPPRSMHHACSDWRSQTFCADSLTDLNPSIARGATLQNVTLHRPQYVALARCSEHSAEPTEKAASAHHRDGAESTGSHSGHSGVIPAITTGEHGQTAGCYGRRVPALGEPGCVVFVNIEFYSF